MQNICRLIVRGAISRLLNRYTRVRNEISNDPCQFTWPKFPLRKFTASVYIKTIMKRAYWVGLAKCYKLFSPKTID